MTSAVRSNSAKRSASGNLSNSSDDEQEDQVHELEPNRSSISSSAGVSDFEANSSFESPSSPGGSSTSSGPVYIRPPGFKYHAQEITRPRFKKKKIVFQKIATHQIDAELVKKREPTPPKHRQTKRDPLPMRMRAFPQSFWQQPNLPVAISPASCHKVLPPLSIKDELDQLRPITPTDEKHTEISSHMKEKSHLNASTTMTSINTKSPKLSERRIIVTGNADMSLAKLFKTVEDKTHIKKSENSHSNGNYKPLLPPSGKNPNRVRPKNNTLNKTMIHGCDPYMVDTIADKLFPHLTLEKTGIKSYHTSGGGGNTSLQLITLREGDKSVTLPSLCIEQNYSQMLSELVPHL